MRLPKSLMIQSRLAPASLMTCLTSAVETPAGIAPLKFIISVVVKVAQEVTLVKVAQEVTLSMKAPAHKAVSKDFFMSIVSTA